ncbi:MULTISPECIES: YggS family pyridoxal phosphate-dependent enzyme [Staphylococcus]|uniref:Pyridoxal phosphate homeostasis protein n=1 Tax=Staphylococcus equorum TaxID=246432 RepID=A0AAW7AIT0_9STAP|nr:YggS family pyridoxal phosphate-dependent enzyme [Staphylococcus equorum]MDG0821407.1 YggS family pyridoxal phosphate-dependent enzyme [Staphylococcus equorum]MDG0837752.1 YggS family pyridoxal phosphate-dependent enzyme [Staphylococcus equorum]MDK9865139.1 YggS family pyridoxal phosphate-dependent enzyme [Staphylococcus equorum]MDN5809676.1 YggS family pyridoxal phosphate-dependent enzyme [Staphylococcus equorum]MDN5828962.1 YggS family pyridoxal phosphate-dependent enzyme [Staphylococcus 
MNVQQNLEQIEKQLKTYCEKGNISTLPNVIAVTKYVTIDRANDAYNAGIRHFGENRLEGFQLKKEALPDDIVMHFIGSLQTRKVKEVINEIDYFHALDRLKLAKEINKRAEHKIKCFVQVNVSGEESKQGVALKDVNTFIETLEQYENLEVVGLMTMAPLTDDESYIKSLFQSLKNKRDEIKALNLNYAPCTELSMGMSNDFHLAAEEGASFVRIGTKLVGKEE